MQTRWLPASATKCEDRLKDVQYHLDTTHQLVKHHTKTSFHESHKDLEFSMQHFAQNCRMFSGIDRKLGPMTITFEQQANTAALLIRSTTGSEHYVLGWPRRSRLWGFMSTRTKLKQLLKEMGHWAFQSCGLLEKHQHELEQKLRHLDSKISLLNFRIGVITVQKGDRMEHQALAHNECGPNFLRFLNFIGDHVSLLGWNSYAGGLDTLSNMTGDLSVFHEMHGGEQIMYHVAPLIPCKPDDMECVGRKCFTGNDIINILFLEEGQGGFKMGSVRSKQTQCIVVARVKDDDALACTIFGKEGVLLNPASFMNEKGKILFNLQFRSERERFNSMLISLERQCYESEPFRSKLLRTRASLLSSIL